MTKELPFCEAGCGRRVKRRKRSKKLTRFCSVACVPHELRVAAGRMSREKYAYKTRAKKFRAELAQLEGKRVTTETLFEVFARIERRGYVSGFRAGREGRVPALGLTA